MSWITKIFGRLNLNKSHDSKRVEELLDRAQTIFASGGLNKPELLNILRQVIRLDPSNLTACKVLPGVLSTQIKAALLHKGSFKNTDPNDRKEAKKLRMMAEEGIVILARWQELQPTMSRQEEEDVHYLYDELKGLRQNCVAMELTP